MKILNLGCGNKTAAQPEVVNIDWSIYLRLRRRRVLRAIAPLLLNEGRRERFQALPSNVLVHNLKRGIPFASDSIDIVYHSHLLEHLDRSVAPRFMQEIYRVLKPGGIQRIVVPDLEFACREYIEHLALCESNIEQEARHDDYVERILEQCVRRESYGTSQQRPLRRFLENLLLGDARKKGETHQWMYDRANLAALLRSQGYRNVQLQTYQTSLSPGWRQYGLDLDEQGEEYKPHSLYVEGQK